ncbi:ABC transporter ATP-binding protein [Bacillus alveayuensis]|uniref:Oligopeptide/dipeptide ABC transporter ATP-binding protein n=1 Tax=Aeribacillus alveayuensis TaxID=279215 RepID=A0ABT9VQU9_9BACI|nr:ABC transporter ATP-binding protein [Bacillus alveayuensis]MDQ0163250.1 oligopeptide/dipeptide ABC transporter ATP-binding protein [Bacillus alveayuensis]
MNDVVLKVKDLKCHFHTRKGIVKAVDGVNFEVKKGEILAIVGESGSGKSVTSQAIMRLIGQKNNERIEGKIFFRGENLLEKSEEEMRRLRGNRISMIFQDPMTSLNPAYRVGSQIAEVPQIHEKKDKKSSWSIAIDMLHRVGIPSSEERANDYPHQFSGGMRQRSVIAMALASNPDLLIADEPTTALDVTIQAQILDLMNDLRNQMGTAIIMITHDLGIVAELCDSVAVMYAGRIVEQAPIKELFASPKHPYTRGLLASLPKPGIRERLTPIEGQPPNLHDVPKGCMFAPRCPHAHEKCSEQPMLNNINEHHKVACWLEEEM